MTIQFSRRLAIAFGILAPLGETIRRWSTWRETGNRWPTAMRGSGSRWTHSGTGGCWKGCGQAAKRPGKSGMSKVWNE